MDLLEVKPKSLQFKYQDFRNLNKIIISQPSFKYHPYIQVLEKYVMVDSQQVLIYKITQDL